MLGGGSRKWKMFTSSELLIRIQTKMHKVWHRFQSTRWSLLGLVIKLCFQWFLIRSVQILWLKFQPYRIPVRLNKNFCAQLLPLYELGSLPGMQERVPVEHLATMRDPKQHNMSIIRPKRRLPSLFNVFFKTGQRSLCGQQLYIWSSWTMLIVQTKLRSQFKLNMPTKWSELLEINSLRNQ